jgi:hypothetical protein
MPDVLTDLEAQRDDVLRQVAQLGDMRKGSMTEAFRRCGRPGCACSGTDHRGHGPYYAFTTKVAGKTKTVQMRAGSRLDKFQREVDTYRQFRALSERLIDVNEAICNARPELGMPIVQTTRNSMSTVSA